MDIMRSVGGARTLHQALTVGVSGEVHRQWRSDPQRRQRPAPLRRVGWAHTEAESPLAAALALAVPAPVPVAVLMVAAVAMAQTRMIAAAA